MDNKNTHTHTLNKISNGEKEILQFIHIECAGMRGKIIDFQKIKILNTFEYCALDHNLLSDCCLHFDFFCSIISKHGIKRIRCFGL